MNIPAALQIFRNKKVFLTGHTGFKGSWLLQILHYLGAEVKGYSLAPTHDRTLYYQINGDALCHNSIIGDIRDLEKLQAEVLEFQPDFVFHLAAQALVRDSYVDPVGTYETNVMGTIHVLEAIRHLPNRCTAVMITTDKVYENPENGIPFVETDKLGGHDPYSSSKACDEILIDSYRNSFFSNINYADHQKSIASVRAGNVIGGGDYAANRIIPDIVRAIENDTAVSIRNPNAIRPWQHVLEPLYAYLCLAANMYHQPTAFNTAYNIGPCEDDMLSVIKVTESFIQSFGKGSFKIVPDPMAVHEAQLLLLNNHKIKRDIGVTPKLSAIDAIEWTADWYADHSASPAAKCLQQIEQYFNTVSR